MLKDITSKESSCIFAESIKRGFTLIELSIVLVIIGLIIGGVIVGKSLIEASQRKNMVGQVEQVRIATNTFRLKYNCIPGDCANATQFLGSAGGTGQLTNGACLAAANTNKGATGTCNGNGNGKIAIEGTGADNERYLIWQHLALAKFINGEYAIVGQGISYGHKPGVNVPAVPYKDGLLATVLIEVSNIQNQKTFSTTLIGKQGLIFGRSYLDPTGTYWHWPNSLLTPLEAKQIDSKFDDGIAYSGQITGIVVTSAANTRGCTSPLVALNAYDPTADYTTSGATANAINCHLAFEYLN